MATVSRSRPKSRKPISSAEIIRLAPRHRESPPRIVNGLIRGFVQVVAVAPDGSERLLFPCYDRRGGFIVAATYNSFGDAERAVIRPIAIPSTLRKHARKGTKRKGGAA